MKKIMFLLFVVLCGCSLKKTAIKQTATLMYDGAGVYSGEQDIQTARETMLPAIKFSESILKSDPDNPKLLELTARGYCSYAFTFLEDTDPRRASLMYEKGLEYSAKLMKLQNLLTENKTLTLKNTPKIFWHAFCMSGYIKLNLDKPRALGKMPELEKITDILIKLNPTHYYNGPYILKAALYAKSPIFGGDYDKSKYYFDIALKGKGAKFKINKLLYADMYARQTLNRHLFEKLLKEILKEPDSMPEEKLLNNIAIERAGKLLGNIDEIF